MTVAVASCRKEIGQILKIKWAFELNNVWTISNKDQIVQQSVKTLLRLLAPPAGICYNAH